MKFDLEFVEIMALNACNLSCEGCTTFSDLKHRGYTEWRTVKEWLTQWTPRVNFKGVGFMGGEPLMHPYIQDWIIGIREILPLAQIRFITNGLLLDKHWDVLHLLDTVGNSVLKISQHLDDTNLHRSIEKLFEWQTWQPVEEFGIHRWKSSSGMRLQINRPTHFYKTFQGSYHDMVPHNNDPVAAFDLCVQKKCPMLHDGKLFKCGTLALTTKVLERFGWPNRKIWLPYLNTGLSHDCKEIELKQFIDNFGKPHSLCRQCPTERDTFSVLDHRKTVKLK